MIRTATLERELREQSLAASDFELRADDDGGARRFTGHAAVFNVRTAIGNPLTWGFYEEVAPGAFTKTLLEGDQRMLIDHQSHLLCARTSAGDLRLAQDKVGLLTDADMDEQLSYVRDLVLNLDARRITGMSFGFYVTKDAWSTEDALDSAGKELLGADGKAIQVEVRRILEVRLLEVSAVTFPAYEETDAALRAVRSRTEPDPLGRRAILLGDDTNSTTAAEPAGATPQLQHEAPPAEATTEPTALTREDRDRQAKAWAARTGLTIPA